MNAMVIVVSTIFLQHEIKFLHSLGTYEMPTKCQICKSCVVVNDF